MALSVLASALVSTGIVHAGNAPVGGHIVAGSGSIQQSGSITTIQQSSPTLQLNWQSFNVGADQTVNFEQPGRNAIAVNRIYSNTASDIFGHLNANGQVWLINPNGVLFGQSAQVNVGGLVASTLDPGADGLTGNQHTFSGQGTGSVINQGTINAATGGYVALLGNQVSNQGVISARLGSIALAGGSAVTLTFDDSKLVHVQVDRSTLNNLAENRQLLVADGGQVIMTAGAKDSLLASVVNNTGMVRAQTVENHNGTITLVGGMTAGQVNVGGQLDASAPSGGDGGSIETSAAHFALAPDAQITAAAPRGRAGTWLVDPTDLTIDNAAATTISTTLNGGTSVVEQTTATGTSGAGVQSPGNGDITVAAPISWSNAAASLTLDAYNAINVNAPVNGAGGVTMLARAANLTIGAGASVVGGTGVTLATAGNFINNGGASAVSTGTSSPWLVYSTNPASDTTGGLTPSFVQYNAPYHTTPATTGNGFLYSLAPTITLTGLTGNVSKIYDGTTTATLSGSNLQTSGLVNGDQITSAIGTYASANAGSNIVVNSPTSLANVTIVTAAGLPVFGYQAGGTSSAAIGTITPAPLTASIVNNPTKVYDGTTNASLSNSDYSFSGFVAGQGATVNQASSASYASSDAGSGIAVNATFTSTNFVANSGTNLANYSLPTAAAGTGTISQAPLLVTGLTTSNKVYDGTRAAALGTSGAALFGLITTDTGQVTLTTSGASAAFVTPNVGNNIQVLANGFVLSGTKANNYFLQPTTYLQADITQKALTITGVTANNKVYDGTTAASLNLGSASISGLVPSDAGNVSLSTTGSTGAFSQANVGNNLSVSANGFSLGGSAAGNYSINALTGVTANITPAPLTIDFLGSPTKVYDGTNAVVLSQSNYSVSGFVAGQSATITQVSGGYATPHAGTGITVSASLTASDFDPAAGTLMSNYTFPTSLTSADGVIQPQPIVVDIIDNPSKVYDGNDVATLGSGNYQVSGVIPGEQINLSPVPTSGTYASANVGYWNVTTTLTPGNFQAGPNTLLSDYALPTTASGMGTIYKKQINPDYFTASITGNPSKVYDGNTIATIAANDFTLSGFVGTDGATVAHTITGEYATKDAGSQPVTATMVESDFIANPGTDLNNYSFPVIAEGTGTIIPAPLIASIINNPTKIYNGSNLAHLISSQFQIDGFVSGEGATITPTTQFTYASANAGSWTITGSLVPSNFTAGSGTLLSNYSLPTTASGPGTINPAPLYIINAYANNKVYDTTTAATLNVSSAALSGLLAGDVGNVTLNTSTNGIFAQSNVGNGIAVTANGFTISGSAASNYLLQPVAGLAANITPAPLIINGAVANNKVYDGTTTATINASGASLSGVLGTDNVTLNSISGTGNFITPNVGNSLQVTSSGFTLSGAQAGNYSVTQPYGLTANITPAPLSVSITGNPIKAYDGSTSVTLTSSDYTLTGFVSGQSATINGVTSSGYLSPNVGTNIGVQATLEPSNYSSAIGTNLSNYLLPTTATGPLGEITAAVITLTGSRVYDATTNADASVFSVNGLVNGVNGQTLGLMGTGTLSSKNVGIHVPLSSLGTLALTDGSGLAANYQLNVAPSDWVTITPATLTVLNTAAATKVYDGTTAATLNGATLNGVLDNANGPDVVTLTNDTSGTFDNKNVGTGKSVATNMGITGTDAGNYTLIQPTGVTGDITPLDVTVSITGNNKVYDGTNAAKVNYISIPNLIAGDNIGYTAGSSTFSQADVGTNLLVTVTNITLTGTDATNYFLTNSGATATTNADITPYILNLQSTRTYNAATDAAATLFGPTMGTGVINGIPGGNGAPAETLTLTGTGTLASKNVGQESITDVNTAYTLTGNSGAKASNYAFGTSNWVDVTQADLNVIGTTAASRPYDGTTNATLSGATLSGVLSNAGVSDNVTLGNDTLGQFRDPNVGNGKPVDTSMTISGTDAGNYKLFQPTDIVANITPLIINATVTAIGHDKVYDGTTAATVDLSSAQVLAQDVNNVSFSGTSNFLSPNVGNGITINVTDISMSGSASTNYQLNNPTTTTSANITPYILNLTGTRVYDSTTDAAASLFGNKGVLNGIPGGNGASPETLTLTGTGTLASKNVNTEQLFATNGLDGFTLTGNNGAQASNYAFGTGDSNWVNITQAPLTITGTLVTTRDYDAKTDAQLTGATLNGVFAGDVVTLGNDTTGTFIDKNAGSGKSVTADTMTISGTDAGNYYIPNQPTGLTGTINPLAITVGFTAQNKVYDTTTTTTATESSSGVLAGDDLTFSAGAANFVTSNVGNGIQVNITGITGSGADLNNYTFSPIASTTANITPYILALSGTRIYNAATDANATVFGNNGVVTGINGQTLNVTGSGTLVSKNVGKEALSSLDTLALTDGSGGGLAGNYQLDVAANDFVTVTPATITVGATAQNKIYDGNSNASVTLSGNGLGSDVVGFDYTSALFNNPNVGNSKLVTVSGISATGADAGNYIVNNIASTSADITPYQLILQGTRVYDGTPDAAASLFGNGGMLTGANNETLTLSGTGTLASKNVSTAQPFTSNGLAGFTLTGNNGASASNYTLGTGAGDWVAITRRALTVTAVGEDKVYDGTTAAQLSSFTVNGLVASDNASLAYANATFAQSNVGNNIPITVNGISGSGSDIGNYTFPGSTTTSGNITAYILGLTGTRVYDGTANAAASLFGNNGVLTGTNGETLTLGGNGDLIDKNVGDQKPFATNGLAGFTLTGNNGALASNYTFAGGTDWVTVTPFILDLTGRRIYDATATAAASLFGNNGVLTGVDGEVLTLSGNGTLADKNVGTQKPLGVNGFSLTGENGALASNYTFTGGTDWLTVLPKPILVTANVADKTYDGTTAATLLGLNNSGIIAGDNVTISYTSAAFLSPNVGNDVPIIVQGVSLTGADAGNYIYPATEPTTASIFPFVLNLTGARVYDGTANAAASLFGNSGVLTGANGETLTLGGNGSLIDKNVGDQKPFATNGLAGFTLTGNNGALASNYTFAGGTDWVTVTPFILDLTGLRIYDGTATAAAGLFGDNGVLTGVDGETLTLSGSGTLVDKNVGRQKAFAANGLAGFTLTGDNGALASNYTFTGGTDWLTVLPKPILVTANVADKTYDGTTAATLLGLNNGGIIAGDNVTIGYTSAAFLSPNVGNDVPIIVRGVSLTGADAGNYIYPATVPTIASIFPFVLNLTGTRVYDSTTNAAASLFGNSGVLTGANGETLTLGGNGNLIDKNVGDQKPFTTNGLAGFTLTGNGSALTSNYTLAGGLDWVTVTPATLTVTGTQTTNRPYDSTTLDDLSGAALAGIQGSDDVVLGNDAVGMFDDPGVGNNKPVHSSMTISGADAGNYVLEQPAGLTADITQPLGPPTPLPHHFPLGYLAALQAPFAHNEIDTPFGTAPAHATGAYTGNQKLESDHPLERNRMRSDFHAGLPLQVVDGGVRLPADKSP